MDKSSLSENDIEILIKMVEDRPCIWNKSCNKDSAEKKKAWREIFDYFSMSKWGIEWEDLDETEQKKCEQELTAKWTNLRDTFTKLVKRRREKNYRHYELLKFFIKNVDVDPLPSTSADKFSGPQEKGRKTTIHCFKRIKKTSPSLRIELKKNRKRFSLPKPFKITSPPIRRRLVSSAASVSSPQFARKKETSVSSPQFTTTNTEASESSPTFVNTSAVASVSSPQFVTTNAVASISSPQFVTNTVASVSSPHFVTNNLNQSSVPNHRINVNTLDEDEAFFISVMPTVKKMSVMDKLEFRIGVLDVLKRVTSAPS